VLETLLFFVTGIFIGDLLTNLEKIQFSKSDVFKGILFFPILNLIRYLVILIQLPMLNKVGFPISCTSALILSYGGLRGAIALSLAMLVFLDPLLSNQLRHLCLYYVLLTITFSVLINGFTIKSLMNATGFLDIDPIKEKMKNNVMRQMLISAFQYKDDVLKKDIDLQGADWDEVSQITHLSFYSILQEFPKLENEYNRQAQEDKLKSIDQSNNFASQISGTPDLFKNKRLLQNGPKEIQESERSLINTSHVPKPSNKNQIFNTHNSAKDLGSHSNILKSISNI
jgi:NhaP-type Na+/H+ or K+/H+ antiporter